MDMATVKSLASTGSSDCKIYGLIHSAWHGVKATKYMGTKVAVAKSIGPMIEFDGRGPVGPRHFVEPCGTCQGSDCRSASSSASGAPCLSVESWNWTTRSTASSQIGMDTAKHLLSHHKEFLGPKQWLNWLHCAVDHAHSQGDPSIHDIRGSSDVGPNPSVHLVIVPNYPFRQLRSSRRQTPISATKPL